jgi:serine/threonine protein kinase
MPNLVESTIGKYRILELLGRGGMAEVYKAHHPGLDRFVTIKIMHRHLADESGFLERFDREAKAVAALRHPHIVQIYDYEASEAANYMVMEFIDGGTLQDRISAQSKEGSYLPIQNILPILRQVADALDYAHEHGILHRDIKPSNILLNVSGNAFLTDFGIARLIGAAHVTVTGTLVGTPAYMSPEQGAGTDITPASDIYSLGIIGFELFTGKVPFRAETTPLAVLHQHMYEPPPDPCALRAGLPPEAAKVILRAVSKNPADRFPSAKEFIRDLEKALPPKIIDGLDNATTQHAIPVASRPTLIMEEPITAEESNPVTPFNNSQIPDPVLSDKNHPPAAPLSTPPAPIVESPALVSTPAAPTPLASPPRTDLQPSGHRKLKPGLPLLSSLGVWFKTHRMITVTSLLVFLAVIGVVVYFLIRPNIDNLACSSVEECVTLKGRLWDAGDREGSLSATNKAIGLIPREKHIEYAWLVCNRADMLTQLNRTPEAQQSRDMCAAWQRGE